VSPAPAAADYKTPAVVVPVAGERTSTRRSPLAGLGLASGLKCPKREGKTRVPGTRPGTGVSMVMGGRYPQPTSPNRTVLGEARPWRGRRSNPWNSGWRGGLYRAERRAGTFRERRKPRYRGTLGGQLPDFTRRAFVGNFSAVPGGRPLWRRRNRATRRDRPR
jgi:hypothetical protein